MRCSIKSHLYDIPARRAQFNYKVTSQEPLKAWRPYKVGNISKYETFRIQESLEHCFNSKRLHLTATLVLVRLHRGLHQHCCWNLKRPQVCREEHSDRSGLTSCYWHFYCDLYIILSWNCRLKYLGVKFLSVKCVKDKAVLSYFFLLSLPLFWNMR